MTAEWTVERIVGAPGDFHARPIPASPSRTVWVFEATSSALVLGSTQSDAVAEPSRQAGMPVVRRQSGGGAVLVRPDEMLWVDVIVPASDWLHHDDVGTAFMWVGKAWQRALRNVGFPSDVHEGAYEAGRWGSLVCFAGVGPGEVLVNGRKVVGISQRRSRGAARFQCAALLSFDAMATAAAVDAEDHRAALEADLDSSVGAIEAGYDDLLASFLKELPGDPEPARRDISPGQADMGGET